MKFSISALTVVWALLSNVSIAQHAGDVEFGYDSLSSPAAFVMDANDFTSEGFRYFESEMEELDPFNAGDFSSDEPGFTANPSEGLLVNAGDQIWLSVLDASVHSAFGVGYVNYFNPTTDSLESMGRMGIYDNSGSTADLILNGNSVESGPLQQFIGLGDSGGDIHDHLIVDILDDSTARLGAYGIMFQLQSDFSVADGAMDLSSDPFWIVWNHGMSESEFDENALRRFGVSAVPEPGSFGLLAMATGAVIFRRRRR
ncbi:MAG: hypothetical protein ACI87E_001451 [Mariniblastus sp.]|jgi:hypothetical protein